MPDLYRFGARKVRVWPEKQPILPLDEPSIRMVHFADHESYHPALIKRLHQLCEDAAYRDFFYRGGCGTKVRRMDHWGSVEADLLQERALALFQHVYQPQSAVIDDSWASMYETGDYCMPHSHVRCVASIVYLLDPGDQDAADETGGRFCFVDPRINACCQLESGRMTNLLLPNLRAGSMLIFPSEFVHAVTPYTGTRARITLSWNLHTQRQAGDPAAQFTRGR